MPVIVKKDAFEKVLHERGFNLNKLALYAKLSKAYLSQLKNNKRNPSPRIVEAILKVLNCDRSDIFEWIPKKVCGQ